jgi:hypothetical protein
LDKSSGSGEQRNERMVLVMTLIRRGDRRIAEQSKQHR